MQGFLGRGREQGYEEAQPNTTQRNVGYITLKGSFTIKMPDMLEAMKKDLKKLAARHGVEFNVTAEKETGFFFWGKSTLEYEFYGPEHLVNAADRELDRLIANLPFA